MNPLNASSLISATGLLGIFLVLVAETGLLIGFFLPGDSLLFTAGLLAATHGALRLPLAGVLAVAVAGALVGAQIGYWIGCSLGPRLLARTRGPALGDGVDRVQRSFEHYGPAKAIVLARFIPIVRTLMNPMAGMLGVPNRVFVPGQILGGVLWTVGVTLAGYVLGAHIPGIDAYLLPIIAVIVTLSLIPVVVESFRARRRRSTMTETTTGGLR